MKRLLSQCYPVNDDSKQNEYISARAYRLLRVGSFLLSNEGYKIFVHESERKHEPRLGGSRGPNYRS